MIPPLPSLRALTRELRELREAWSHPDAGGGEAALTLIHDDVVHKPRRWRVRAVDPQVWGVQYGREYIPGSCSCPAECNAGRTAGGFDGYDVECLRCQGTGHVHSDFDAVAAARRLLAAARDGMVSKEEI